MLSCGYTRRWVDHGDLWRSCQGPSIARCRLCGLAPHQVSSLASLLVPKCTMAASCGLLGMLAFYLAGTLILMRQVREWRWYHGCDWAGRCSSSLSSASAVRRRTDGVVNDLLQELVARGKLFPKEEAMCQTSVSQKTCSVSLWGNSLPIGSCAPNVLPRVNMGSPQWCMGQTFWLLADWELQVEKESLSQILFMKGAEEHVHYYCGL